MVKKNIKDITVQETNDSSILSKASIVELGYFNDPYLKLFCKRIARRAPLINRGYYIRAKAIDHVLKSFLTETKDFKKVQIFSLGAGFDTSYFRLKAELVESFSSRCKYIEIDFPDVVKRKLALLQRSEVLTKLIGDFRIKTDEGVLDSKDLSIVPCDLTDLDKLQGILQFLNVQFDTPSLFFSECVFTYVDYKQANLLMQWIQRKFANCLLVVYEQISPNDPFGKVMMKHFNKIQSPLKRIKELNSLQKHKNLLSSRGFLSAVCFDMNYFFKNYISEEEKERMMKLEVFDEYEEWHLKCSHYCIVAGGTGNCSVLSKEMFPESPTDQELYQNLFTKKFKMINTNENPSVMRFGHCVTRLTDNRFLISGGFGTSETGGHKRLKDGVVVTITADGAVAFSEGIEMEQRMFHSATQISENIFFLFGGRLSPAKTVDNYGVYRIDNDVAMTTIVEKSRNNSNCCPDNRWRHSAVLFEGLILMYGGCGTNNRTFEDMWCLNPSNLEWKKVKISRPLIGCHSHSMNAWRNHVIIYGGLTNNMEVLNRLCIVTPKDSVYDVEDLSISPPIPKRYSHSAHVINDKLVVIGGIDPSINHEPPIIIVDLLLKQWKQLDVPPSGDERPVMLHNHSSMLDEQDESKVFIIGGGGNCFSFGTHFNKNITCLDFSEIINV